jgi:hypothetical protein
MCARAVTDSPRGVGAAAEVMVQKNEEEKEARMRAVGKLDVANSIRCVCRSELSEDERGSCGSSVVRGTSVTMSFFVRPSVRS